MKEIDPDMAAGRVAIETLEELEHGSLHPFCWYTETVWKGRNALGGERDVVSFYCVGPARLQVCAGDVDALDVETVDEAVADEHADSWEAGEVAEQAVVRSWNANETWKTIDDVTVDNESGFVSAVWFRFLNAFE